MADEKIPPGHWLYSIQHRKTRVRKEIVTDNLEDSISKLGWMRNEVWVLPIKSGPPKKDTELPLVELAIIGGEVPPTFTFPINKPDTSVSKKSDVKAAKAEKSVGEKKVPMKELIIDAICEEPQIGKEKVLAKIYDILLLAAVNKGQRSDPDHIRKRSNLSYYFYKKESDAKRANSGLSAVADKQAV